MEIPLKYKYRLGLAPGSYVYAPKHTSHSDNGRIGPKRHKLTGARLAAAQEATARNRPVAVLRADGKLRMQHAHR